MRNMQFHLDNKETKSVVVGTSALQKKQAIPQQQKTN